jgi:beta-1,4-N-acetylglucosaminyltransferase
MIKKGMRKKVLFVSSAGGHFAQILEMNKLFDEFRYLLVTEDIPATRFLENKYKIKYTRPAGNGRNFEFWINFFINFCIAFKIIISFKPTTILTTGSHTAIPFCYIGKIFGAKIIYILSYSKIKSKQKAANIIYQIADIFIVQWKSAQKNYPKSKFLGGGLY